MAHVHDTTRNCFLVEMETTQKTFIVLFNGTQYEMPKLG